MKLNVNIEIDTEKLGTYSDAHLATAWHVAQANPAPHDDPVAGQVAEHVGREIIRRWLGANAPELWHHQGQSYYWQQLCRFAKYQPPEGSQPGSPEWHQGAWVPRVPDDQEARP